jgi:hemolysin activation/secretion protein
MSFDTTRKQNLDASGNWYAIAHIRGQLSTDNLDPYEKMTIGGASGVRAFGVDEGSYDEGVIATLSLARRFVLPTGDQLAPNLFVDYANGYVNHGPYANWQALGGYVNNGLSNHRILAGYGIGLDWVNPHGALVSVSWSRPFATSSSSINNPEEYGSHVWLTLGFRF